MASIERTAYPRFKQFMSARELHVFYTPQPDEIVWAREAAGSDEHLLALVVLLKAFDRLGYFPVLDEVPARRWSGTSAGICGCRSMSPRCTPRPARPSGTAAWSGRAARRCTTRRGRGGRLKPGRPWKVRRNMSRAG